MTDWDALSHTATAPETEADRIERYASELLSAEAAYDAAKAQIEKLEAEIARLYPEDEGEFTKMTKSYAVSVTRREQLSWDKEKLAEKFVTRTLPHYVKQSLSIDKKEWQRLSPAEQDDVKDCLTRKLSKPKIEVKPL